MDLESGSEYRQLAADRERCAMMIHVKGDDQDWANAWRESTFELNLLAEEFNPGG